MSLSKGNQGNQELRRYKLPARVAQILLVEDNAGDAALITTLMKESCTSVLSFEVHHVLDGESATDYLFQRGKYSNVKVPDLVILDLNLPGKRGFEVLSEMKKKPSLEKIPAFIFTTSAAHEDILKSYSLGAASFMTKPDNLAALEDMIKRLCTFELPRILCARDAYEK